MSDLIAINAGAFNLAIQALKRAGKDEIAEQLESDCECVPDLIEQQQARIAELEVTNKALEQNRDQYKREAYALAATVERLRDALNQSLISWGYVGVPNEEGETYKECEKRLEETPQQSLAERDANLIEGLCCQYSIVVEIVEQGKFDMVPLSDLLEYTQRIKDGE